MRGKNGQGIGLFGNYLDVGAGLASALCFVGTQYFVSFFRVIAKSEAMWQSLCRSPFSLYGLGINKKHLTTVNFYSIICANENYE